MIVEWIVSHQTLILVALFVLSEILGEIQSIRENSVFAVFKRIVKVLLSLLFKFKT